MKNQISKNYLMNFCNEIHKAGGSISGIPTWLDMSLQDFILKVAEPNNLSIKWYNRETIKKEK